MATIPYGFRVVGSAFGERRLVDWEKAFIAYCACHERANVQGEAYLSAFTFGADFRRHLDATGSTRGFAGACGSPWLWWDIDRADDLDAATADGRRLAACICERYRLDADALLIFFSGSKGFHLGLPLSVAGSPPPSVMFHRVARRMAEKLAADAGVTIDEGVYDKVRLFRAPNSRHPKTGLFKRRLALDELLHLRTDAILRLAADPEPFDLPPDPTPDPQAVDDWQSAAVDVDRAEAAKRDRLAAGGATLNRRTLDVLRGELPTGDRHRLLFSAAANLAEFACPAALAHALLTDAGRDAGLSPGDVRRQIDCGLAAGGGTDADAPAADTSTPPTGTDEGKAKGTTVDLQAALAAMWR